MKVRLQRYDWIVINTSGGKDSQAMTDEVVRRAEALGIKDRVVMVHADLSEEEWEGTKELAAEHAAHYGVRFEVVKRKQGGILQHVLDRHAGLVARGKGDTPPWPSSEQRWCTSDHKRGQVATLFTKLADESRARHGRRHRTRLLNCMGMRAGESCSRAKLLPFKLNRATNGRRVVHDWLPIFTWSQDQVWERIRAAGTRHHAVYDAGMPRLSCCFCIFAPRNALMLAGQMNRPLLDEYVAVEEKTGFSFQSKLSLKGVRDALDRGEEAGATNTWEM